MLRTCNALGSGDTGAGVCHGTGVPSTRIPGILREVHLGLPPSGVKGGRLSAVSGPYEYFHYMQPTGNAEPGQPEGKYDDCGWGCAYRSLMSIISWFRLAGYTSLPNPTHYEIQTRLVRRRALFSTSALRRG